MPPSEQIPFEGVLNCWNDEHDLPDLLLAISRAGKTGRLHFSNPEGDKTVFIRDGRIIFAESSSADDGLGQFLLRTGQLSLMDYTRVSKLVEPGKRLGAVLVEEGVLDPKELVFAVVGQVRDVILGLFRRTETWYRFKEEEPPRKEAITLDMPVAQLIVDGVQNVESWRRISKGIGSLESVYRLVEAGRTESDTIQIEGSVMELLEMLEEPVSIEHICKHATLPDFEACRHLWAFRCLGWIELAELEATEPVPEPIATAAASETITAPAVTPPFLEPAVAAATAATEPEIPKPAVPDPALAQTQVAMDIETSPPAKTEEPAPTAIPQDLVQTQRTVKAPAQPEAPPPPRPIPDKLVQTQVALEPPTFSKPRTPEPSPQAPVPRPTPENLSSTQLYMSHPSFEPVASVADPAPKPEPTTSDMMEAILEGEDSVPAPVPQPSIAAKAPAAAPSPAATQLNVEDSYADFTPSGFEALAMGNDLDQAPPSSGPTTLPSVSPPAPTPSAPLEAADEEMTSFGDLTYGDESFEDVKAEPSMVDEFKIVEAEALPMVEAVALPAEPAPLETVQTPPSGMEALVVPDPIQAGGAPQFATDDPLSAPASPGPQDPPIPPPPKRRRRTEDMDLDTDGLGHILGDG